MVQAPGPCPRCGSENLEKCHKPNGGPAWFCTDCTWIGDAQSIAEGCPGLASMPKSKPPVEDVQAMTAEPNGPLDQAVVHVPLKEDKKKVKVAKVARVRRDEKGRIVVHHDDRTFLYRNKKELKADGPMMDILNPYRNYAQATLEVSLKAKEKVEA